ncbi:GH92 family glycosyl hydrolase [Actinospica robiniae]|uniref:GH92 family glycosyl hydrolase n=1 Tax=Actinospica robiniae TaxID=304901 RepID=UPI0004055057|nr:GH92 family glycosyl hydrolase [Actinospica robiniae]
MRSTHRQRAIRHRTLRHGVAALAAATLSLGVLGAGVQTAAAAALPQTVGDPTALVDPFIGTGDGGGVVGPVNSYPGASAPFGMLNWSPDTTSRPSAGGYAYTDSSTIGFSVTHVSGAGCGIAGDLPILPTVGTIGTNPTSTTAPFSHADETAAPGSYSTTIGTGSSAIGVDLAATTRTGLGSFTYPAGSTANVLFKVGDSQAFVNDADVSIVGDDQVTGSITEGKFCDMPNKSTVYFAAQFNRPFTSEGTWNGSTVNAGSTSATGSNSGAYVGFDTSTSATVGMRVSVSYVSVADAQANLRAEQHGWSVSAVAAQTRSQWRKLLSEIEIGGGTHAQQAEFYTALYHALLEPSTFSDANGDYMGMDDKVHRTAAGQAQYTTFSGWDIYRDEVPLLAVLAPKQTSAMMQSLVNDAKQGGWLPKWPVANGYTGMMGGDSADAIIAEAYAFGARDFDTAGALSAMVKGASVVQDASDSSDLGQGTYEERPGLDTYLKDGYVVNDAASSGSAVPDGASLTLEYATDDFAISQFAGDLGRRSTAEQFLTRSQNWTNIYNVDSGFLQPRDASGAFPTGNPVSDGLGSFGQSGFQEGNAAQYLFSVPQNLNGLIGALGGDTATVSRLDTFFQQDQAGPDSPYYWAGNEVDMLAPWVYDYAGAPYKTQAEVHALLDDVYADTPAGEPGNDDLGATSSWYVWGALGMYPETPGAPVLALSAPIFPVVHLNLPSHQLSITAPGASDQGYVSSMSIDGRNWQKAWIPASDLVGGAGSGQRTSIGVGISATPNTRWAASAQDAPPSYPAGKTSFPTGVVPSSVASDPAGLTATAGSSDSATLTFTLGVGAYGDEAGKIRQLHWTAQPPEGVTVSPASGTAQVSGDTATVTVSFDVAADAPQGFSQVGFALSDPQDVPLPTLTVPVAVIGPGDTATVCTTLDTTNTDNGLIQQEGGDGTTTPVTVDGMTARQTTESAPGDLNMYFQVDKRLVGTGDYAATVTFEYYDTGTNNWQLQYAMHGGSAYTGAGSVTNTNTNTWKTVTFNLPDAAVSEAMNNQADFRIWSADPVTIHSAVATITGAGVLPMDLCPAS